MRSGEYRPLFKWFYLAFIIVVFILGYVGGSPAEEPYITIGQVCTVLYFAYFLIVLPFLPKIEKVKRLPESIAAAYAKSHK